MAFSLFCAVSVELLAQSAANLSFEPSLKFGKPSDQELKLTTYQADTSAVAVVLYDQTDVRYDLIAGDFQLACYRSVKIKVLKSEGTSCADITIPYYANEDNKTSKEFISQINAMAYNMEGNKMVRTKLENKLIFKERINKNYMQMKFSIPNVKVGTVFEYRYRLVSDFYYNIASWEAQKDIPVLFTQYEVLIPEYFQFNIEMRGREKLKTADGNESQMFSVNVGGGQREQVSCSSRKLTFIGRQLPALRSDKYIWCSDDYRSGVAFELKGLSFPGAPYKSFTISWVDIDDMLMKDDSFGKLIKMRNPYREEMTLLGIDKLPTIPAKVEAVYNFLKKKMSWNEHYEIYSNDIKKAIKEGSGSNADINFVLMSMLRDAEVTCYPVVMSRKTMGILPITHPSIQKLNTFVIAIANTDTTFTYLDGSSTTGYLDILPPQLMVDRARLIGCKKADNWVDLSRIGRSQIKGIVNVVINPDGKLTGTRTAKYLGQYASGVRRAFQVAKDSTAYIRQLESSENIKVTAFNTKNIETFSPEVFEEVTFEKQATVNDNFIYINPLVFMHVSKNKFLETERKLPVELPYAEEYGLTTMLTLPEGYVIDEMPKPMSICTEDGSTICTYNIQVVGQKVMLRYAFKSNKLLFLSTEYPSVKMFWESLVEKNNEMIVLKKI